MLSSRSLTLAPIAIIAVAATACPGNEPSQRVCLSDADCLGLMRCIAGLCTAECASDATCVAIERGKHCVRGGCTDLSFDGDFHVDVGENLRVSESARVTLDGRGSRYVGEGVLAVQWVQVGGPPVTLVGADSLRAELAAPRVVSDAAIDLRLVLSDGLASAQRDLRVFVRDTINELPIVSVTAPSAPVREGDFVVMDARATEDPNPSEVLAFRWEQTAGPAVALGLLAAPVEGSLVGFRAPRVEAFVELAWTLNVTDSRGGRATADVRVSVRDLNTVACAAIADCVTGADCVVVDCTGGLCLDSIIGWCCGSERTCADTDPCTADRCVPGLGCVHEPIAGCCRSDDECAGGAGCLEAFCDEDGRCAERWIGGCCARAEDCEPSSPCARPICVDGACEDVSVEGCCAVDEDCDDGFRCTLDSCDRALGRCRHEVAHGCCASDRDCPDTNPCEQVGCDVPSGTCVAEAAEACCTADEGCDDGDPCTRDGCELASGQCSHERIIGCCRAHAECADPGPCTVGLCVDSRCVEQIIESCCDREGDEPDVGCDDADRCTEDACAPDAGRCWHRRREACCADDSECDDGHACTRDLCDRARGRCQSVPIAGCCGGDEECADANPCTDDACVDGSCRHAPRTSCCAGNQDCDDGDACTADQCDPATQLCEHSPIPSCCASDDDCEAVGSVCAPARCSTATGRCAEEPDPVCCADDLACEPAGPCVVRTCDEGSCRVVDLPACCETGTDCDDGDPCTDDSCVDGRCAHLVVEGCCRTRDDCPPAGPCAEARCNGDPGVCEVVGVPECCLRDDDCTDLNPCTADRCVASACTHDEIEGCCLVDRDCQVTRTCERSECRSNLCEGESIAGCCGVDEDCDDGDPCTADACDLRTARCEHARRDACCVVHADCDDGDRCTVDECTDDGCTHAGADPSCCDGSGDCDDGDPCTVDLCELEGGICAQVPLPACCTSDERCSGDECRRGYCDAEAQRCTVEAESSCCVVAEDCGAAPPCAELECEEGRCEIRPTLGCCSTDADCDDRNPCTEDTCSVEEGCVHGGSAAQLGDACDDGDEATRSDVCDAEGSCAGIRAWSLPHGPAATSLTALGSSTDASGGVLAGGFDSEGGVLVVSGDAPRAYAVGQVAEADVVALSAGWVLTSDGGLYQHQGAGAVTQAATTGVSPRSRAAEAPWSALAVETSSEDSATLALLGGREGRVASCHRSGEVEALLCVESIELIADAEVRALAFGPDGGPALWALATGASTSRIYAADARSPELATWSAAAPDGCGEAESPCDGAGRVWDLHADGTSGAAWAVGEGGAVLGYDASEGWRALPGPSRLDAFDDAETLDLRTLAVRDGRLAVAASQARCARAADSGACVVQGVTWWVIVADVDEGSDPTWRAAVPALERRCGVGVGTPCPEGFATSMPHAIALTADGGWWLAGRVVETDGRRRGVLLWRR